MPNTNALHPHAAKRQNSGESNHHGPDKTILLTTMALSFFGWIMIYSGSFYVASQRINTIFKPNNPYHFFILQGFWILAGVIAGFIMYKIPVRAYKALILPGLLATVVLLIVVLLLPSEINGAKLWIKLGPFSLQPSELAKPAIIIYLASLFSKFQSQDFTDYGRFFKHKILPFSLVVGPIVLLVLAGKDLATAGLIAMIAGLMFFMSDNHYYTNSTVLGLVGIGIIFGIVFTTSEGYRMERVKTFTQVIKTGTPDKPLSSGYQLNQILTAVGSGGFDGYGFGQSKQKYYYLQETAFSDTIFAVIAEEFGFIGSIGVIAAFIIFVLRGIKISQHANNKFASLMALGVSSWIFLQAIIHLGVNVGMFPLTGITLPFMSYGGSSFISCMIGVGILLNVSKTVKSK